MPELYLHWQEITGDQASKSHGALSRRSRVTGWLRNSHEEQLRAFSADVDELILLLKHRDSMGKMWRVPGRGGEGRGGEGARLCAVFWLAARGPWRYSIYELLQTATRAQRLRALH